MLLSSSKAGGLTPHSNANGTGSQHGSQHGSHRMTDDQDALPPHPLGLRPLGNKYFTSGKDARESSGIFQALPDDMIMQLLEFLDQRSLRILGYTCRFLYAHCIYDDLWKTIFLESDNCKKSPFEWRGSWRGTVLGLPSQGVPLLSCSNVYSDVLHRPFVCSQIRLDRFASKIPASNQIDQMRDLSYAEFAEKWSSKPFILTECTKAWPVSQSWDISTLLRLYSDVVFRAEAVDWTFETYCQYLDNNQDESPLYLFDRKFAEKMNLQIGMGDGTAYWKPECFGPDLFEVLGKERPAHRWLIIGPERSGSTFHKDPNATSAWNAVIQGAKYWIMFPPSASVPGVYVSQDNSEVTSPLSIAEWLLEFHAEARQLPECKEGICKAGEILHVPSGWWHLVVNLEAGIALTQNFVPKSHLGDALSFLKDRSDQVSGFKKEIKDPYGLFVERLEEEYPDLLEKAQTQLAERNAQKKRRWDIAVGNTTEVEGDQPQKKSTGFSFGFGFGDDEDDIP